MQNKLYIFRNFLFTLVLVTLFFSCQREIETLAPISYDYYPLVSGKYKIYEIDSIVYDEYNCKVDTIRFQLKEITGDTIKDGENNLAYKVERYHRIDSSQAWVMIGVWLEKIEGNQLQRVEENQRMIKLVFPIKKRNRWDGIVYIRRDTLVPLRGGAIHLFKDWDYFNYTEIDQPYSNLITGQYYEKTVLVVQVDKTNNIERRFSTERYAKNIGLVYKEMKILDSQCRGNMINQVYTKTCANTGNIANCIFLDWETKAEKGFILKQTLIEHNY